MLHKPVLYLSHFFKRHRQAYYEHLQAVRDVAAIRTGSVADRVERLLERLDAYRLAGGYQQDDQVFVDADETLRVLHGQRCLAQLQAWLSGLMTAAR